MVLGGICCGMIADKWQCHRTVVTLVCLVSLTAIATQPAVSVYYGNPETNKCPSSIIKQIQQTADVGTNSSLKIINCDNSTDSLATHSNCTGTSTKLNNNNNTNYDSQTLYIIMFLLNFCFAFSEGSSVTFVDSGALRRSQLSAGGGRPIQYGRQRMFASVGATFGIVVMNLSVDIFPENTKITCYTGIFVSYGIYTALYGAFTILSYRGLSFREVKEKEDGESGNGTAVTDYKDENTIHELRETSQLENNVKLNNQPSKEESKFWKVFIKTFFQYETLFFYLTTFISGLEYSQYTSFLFVYLKEMDAPSSLLTIAIILSNCASGICFAYAVKMIRLLGGKWRALLFSFFMYFVRYMGISLIQNPWLVFLFQPLHGITATLFVATGLMHLKETSPLPVFTTLVSIFNAIHYGLGTFIGSSISGVIYQRYGGRALFRYTALLSICWFGVLLVYVLFKEKRGRKNDKKSADGLGDTKLIEKPSIEDKM